LSKLLGWWDFVARLKENIFHQWFWVLKERVLKLIKNNKIFVFKEIINLKQKKKVSWLVIDVTNVIYFRQIISQRPNKYLTN